MLEGRVALITGAGNGLGREHALLFASLGAKVVVNDLGSASDGSGNDTSAAQAVVNEITAAGGEAVASTESVSDFAAAKGIVEAAVEHFGDLHVVVNNAGILRDSTIVSMTENDFDAVIAVHLKGTFNMTKQAAAYWRERSKAGESGRRAIVNTGSGSGLIGLPGQANYSAAKAGITAMTLVAAKEFIRYGVKVNCIAPIARTRLTLETPGLSDQMNDRKFDPGNVSPLVAYLASERCDFTGQIFSVYGGSVGIYGGWSIGGEVHNQGRWTADALADAMERELPRAIETRHSNAFGRTEQAR